LISCSIFLSWRPCPTVGRRRAQIGLRIALHSNLFSVRVAICCRAASTFCPIPSCFRLVNKCFLQFSLRSRCSLKYSASLWFEGFSSRSRSQRLKLHRSLVRKCESIFSRKDPLYGQVSLSGIDYLQAMEQSCR